MSGQSAIIIFRLPWGSIKFSAFSANKSSLQGSSIRIPSEKVQLSLLMHVVVSNFFAIAVLAENRITNKIERISLHLHINSSLSFFT